MPAVSIGTIAANNAKHANQAKVPRRRSINENDPNCMSKADLMTCRNAENSRYFSIVAPSATGQTFGGTEARLPFLRFHGAQSASVGHLLSACFYSEKSW